MLSLLLDENIAPSVAVHLATEGINAVHVRDRDMLGASDAEVLERSYVEDRVLVTKNVDDFVALARTRDLHAGIILIERGDLLRNEQLASIRSAYHFILRLPDPDMANRALFVATDGSMHVEKVP